MLPEFTDDGLLPPGIHRSDIAEFKRRFAVFNRSDRRWEIFQKIEALLTEAKRSGIVRRVLVAGSYVPDKAD